MLNVRGLNSNTLRNKLFTWLKELKLHVIFLQETYCQSSFESSFKLNWDSNIIHNFTDSSHSRGVCIMFNDNINVEILNKHCSDDGRILLTNVKIHDKIFCLVNLYALYNETKKINI